MSSFSSWGPTDDGRIKPDLVADGVSVTSTGGNSTTSYATLSGTSMAAPNTTGSLLLLQEYYNRLRSGSFMRSST
ncbi:S8 family serine peptidase, partial [Acinetobacter baumannii]